MMKSIHILDFMVLFGLFMAISGGCSTSKKPSPAYGLISAEDAKELLSSGQITTIDVRTPQEVSKGTIKGALNIDYFDADFSRKLTQLDRAKTYLVFCHKGGRSGKALNMMDSLGFTKVYDLDGGYEKWTLSE